MSLLVESIKLEDGKLLNISLHNARIIRSLSDVFGINTDIDLEKFVTIPCEAKKGVFKCRIEYDNEIRKVEFIPYVTKRIASLKIIEDNTIMYAHKFADRKHIDRLFLLRERADDILIIKNGMVTDTSFANVLFKDFRGNWITPSTFLLSGTRRKSLLISGSIREAVIKSGDIGNYTHLKLINAMIGLNDTEGIPIKNIT
jgi:4-amino-4-deoxychorismate lyase